MPDGGHLSHGWHLPNRKVTLISKFYEVSFYKVNSKTGLIDYETLEKQAVKLQPMMIVSGGTAYPREINHQKLGSIAKKVGAYYLADVSHEAGLIVGGANRSPFPYADVVMMTTHKTLRGPRGALIFSKKEISSLIDQSVFPGLQGGPHNHTIAGIAIALEKAKNAKFKKYALQTVLNAKTLAKELKKNKLTLVTGDTDKHLLLIDLRPQKINSWFVARALEEVGIVVNRNAISPDGTSPKAIFYPSGIRLGTPALTSRGMKENQMKQIAKWITFIIKDLGPRQIPDEKAKREKILNTFEKQVIVNKLLKQIRLEVKKMCDKFPTD